MSEKIVTLNEEAIKKTRTLDTVGRDFGRKLLIVDDTLLSSKVGCIP